MLPYFISLLKAVENTVLDKYKLYFIFLSNNYDISLLIPDIFIVTVCYTVSEATRNLLS